MLAADTCRMAKKPEPAKPMTWSIYKIAAKAIRLGTVEAVDEATAIEKAAAEFKVPATRLMAIESRNSDQPERFSLVGEVVADPCFQFASAAYRLATHLTKVISASSALAVALVIITLRFTQTFALSSSGAYAKVPSRSQSVPFRRPRMPPNSAGVVVSRASLAGASQEPHGTARVVATFTFAFAVPRQPCSRAHRHLASAGGWALAGFLAGGGGAGPKKKSNARER
jgi:hypothetical protein